MAYMKTQNLHEEVILFISVTEKKRQAFKLKVLSAGHSGYKTALMTINISLANTYSKLFLLAAYIRGADVLHQVSCRIK